MTIHSMVLYLLDLLRSFGELMPEVHSVVLYPEINSELKRQCSDNHLSFIMKLNGEIEVSSIKLGAKIFPNRLVA